MEKRRARAFPPALDFRGAQKGAPLKSRAKRRGCAGIYPNRNFTGQPLLYRAHPPPRGPQLRRKEKPCLRRYYA